MLPLQGNLHKERQGIRDNKIKVLLSIGASQQVLPLRILSLPLKHDSIPCMKLSFHLNPKGCHLSLIFLQGNHLPNHINYHNFFLHPQCMKLSLHHHRGSHPPIIFLLGSHLSNHILLHNHINCPISCLPPHTLVDFSVEFSNG